MAECHHSQPQYRRHLAGRQQKALPVTRGLSAPLPQQKGWRGVDVPGAQAHNAVAADRGMAVRSACRATRVIGHLPVAERVKEQPMAVLRFLLKTASIIAAALAGNWVGGQLRAQVTGQDVQSIRFLYTDKQGSTISNTPVLTKFYPAVAAAAIGKPRWLAAFLGGVAAGALVDERYERALWERIGQTLLAKRSAVCRDQATASPSARSPSATGSCAPPRPSPWPTR